MGERILNVTADQVAVELTATKSELSAAKDDLALAKIEVQRTKDALQTLSEGHDTNRRELQAAIARVNELANALIQKMANDAIAETK